MLLALPIYGMKESEESPRIAIKNSYKDRIKVLWKTDTGKSRYEIIYPFKDPNFITKLDKLDRDSAITFQAYGKIKGWLSWSTSVEVKDLYKKLNGKHNQDLYIQVLPWYGVSFNFKYSTEPRTKDVLRLDQVILRNFPALEHHEEIIQAIKAERDKENYKKDVDVIFTGFKTLTLDTPIKDKEGNQIATVEDVYRYILGFLDTNYTKEDVKLAHAALSNKYKGFPENKTLTTIKALLTAAQVRLIKGLERKQ